MCRLDDSNSPAKKLEGRTNCTREDSGGGHRGGCLGTKSPVGTTRILIKKKSQERFPSVFFPAACRYFLTRCQELGSLKSFQYDFFSSYLKIHE